jgi:hypothetical protein
MQLNLRSNGNGKLWLGCCWCPAQPKAIERSDDAERDGLLCLAQAKKAGWSVKNVAGRWQGLCPECQRRGCGYFSS